MKKLVLCFDTARASARPSGDPTAAITNTGRVFRLLDERPDQMLWYRPGPAPRTGLARLRWRTAAADEARATITSAYQFLVDHWEPGDRVYMFGGGRGAYCAQTLTRLLNIVGVLPDLMESMAAYALPPTKRAADDWERVRSLADQLTEKQRAGIPVWFLGLWDTTTIPGFSRCAMPIPMTNVEMGRHALAIDGLPGERLVDCERVEEQWFRGASRDIVGGAGACAPLASIAFDWVLSGAIGAGLAIPAARRALLHRPTVDDALTETPPTIGLRTVPEGATVHDSVERYLREHPDYWRRLPESVQWADPKWAETPVAATTPAELLLSAH
ncbi:phospholipase effector Tle1 domain-containing protein [Mycolicibacterium phlei]|uniref:phospholipase effector Tle1 domain-containing protein n=1 Tax=Mycolicibacterium phlei TaxID=1771 RepID=UPI0037C84021